MDRSIVICLFIIFSIVLSPLDILAEINQPEYTVEVNLDPENRSATGNVEIKWMNDTGIDLEKLGIKLWYNGYTYNQISDLKINGETRDIEKYLSLNRSDDYYELYYVIHDEDAFKNGELVQLQFNCSLENVGDSYGFIHYTGNWIPTLMPIHDGKPTFLREQWGKYEVDVAFPQGWKSCSTGITSKENLSDSLVHQTLKAEDVTNFAVLLYQDFILLESQVDGIKINSYYREGDDWCGKFLFDRAKEIIRFYKKEFGYYPQPIVNILPGAEKPYGGYPVAANCLVVHRGLDESREDFTHWILAHEIGHMYWGYGNVLEDLTGCRWFGLSMGIYTDWLYSKSVGLPDYLHENFESRYINGVLMGYNTDLSQSMPELYAQAEMDWNNVVAHGKSFTVLKTLQNEIGQNVFRNIHQHLLDKYPGKTVSMKEFRQICQEVSGEDLGQFFHYWYNSNEVLDYRISGTKRWQEENRWITEVTIEKYGDIVNPVEISVTTSKSEERKSIDGWAANDVLRFVTDDSGCQIQLDPDKKLPLLTHYLDEYETTVSIGARLVNNGKLLEARTLLSRALGLTTTPIPRHYYFVAKEKMLRGEYEAALKSLDPLFKMKEGESLDFYLGHGNIIGGKTNDLLGYREKAIEYYNKAKKYEEAKAAANQYLEKPYEIR